MEIAFIILILIFLFDTIVNIYSAVKTNRLYKKLDEETLYNEVVQL